MSNWQTPITTWGQPGQTVPGADDFNRIEGNIDILGKYDRAPGYGTATGTNTKTITLSPAPGSYYDGLCFAFKNATQNTGAVTINVNSMGAKSIKKPNGNDLAAGNLKAGSIYTLRYNGTNFILQGEGGEYGTAQPEHVLEDYTFGTEEGVKQGEMTNNGPASAQTVNLTSQNQEYTISQGYHTGLRKIKAAISGLVASVIKAGTTVGGILGTFTSDATATAERILSGYSAYVNGSKVNGTMPNRGSNNIQAQFESDVSISEGYYGGGGKVLKPVISPGTNLITSADTERSTNPQDGWVKKKEVRIRRNGTYRISFEFKSQALDDFPQAQIYKNGSPYGTLHTNTFGGYITRTQDLAFDKDDLCQLYINADDLVAYCKNFRIYSLEGPFDPEVLLD